MIVLALLPLFVVIATSVVVWSPSSQSPIRGDVRLAIVSGYIGTVAGCLVCAEVLGRFSALHAWPVRAAWIVTTLALAIYVFRAKRLGPFYLTLRTVLYDSPFASLALLVAALFLLSTALLTPPNNYDSLTYHLARMEMWIQHGSLEDFPTENLRQLEFGPLSSILFLHLRLLTGSDVLFNAVQLSALVVMVIPAASWIAEQLGARNSVRQILVVAIATTPMVILQSCSTQNDLLVGGFLLAVVAFGWVLWRAHDGIAGANLGIAVGCAIATKGTALVFGLPIALWWLCQALRRGIRPILGPALVAGLAAVLLPLGYFSRNYSLTGSLIGEKSRENRPLLVAPAAVVSILLKNISLHSITPSHRINKAIEHGYRLFHTRVLNLDADDPSNNFGGTPFSITNRWRHEDFAGNPVQFGMIVVAGLATVWTSVRRKKRCQPISKVDGGGFGWVFLGGLVLFSATLSWQPWGSRLMTPLFCLGMIWSASRVSFELPRWTVGAGCGGLILLGLPWFLLNESRPLLSGPHSNSILVSPRETQQISWGQKAREFEELCVELARHAPKSVGFHVDGNTAEYPIQRFLETHLSHPEFFHVGVTNYSAVQNRQEKPADLVISNMTDTIEASIAGHQYTRIWKGTGFSVYESAERAIEPS